MLRRHAATRFTFVRALVLSFRHIDAARDIHVCCCSARQMLRFTCYFAAASRLSRYFATFARSDACLPHFHDDVADVTMMPRYAYAVCRVRAGGGAAPRIDASDERASCVRARTEIVVDGARRAVMRQHGATPSACAARAARAYAH